MKLLQDYNLIILPNNKVKGFFNQKKECDLHCMLKKISANKNFPLYKKKIYSLIKKEEDLHILIMNKNLKIYIDEIIFDFLHLINKNSDIVFYYSRISDANKILYIKKKFPNFDFKLELFTFFIKLLDDEKKIYIIKEYIKYNILEYDFVNYILPFFNNEKYKSQFLNLKSLSCANIANKEKNFLSHSYKSENFLCGF